MRRQTYSYLPSRKASPPIGWYQIILLGDRGTCACSSCRKPLTRRPFSSLYWISTAQNYTQHKDILASVYRRHSGANVVSYSRNTTLKLTSYPDGCSDGEPGISQAAESFTFVIDVGDEAPRHGQERVETSAGASVDGREIHGHRHAVFDHGECCMQQLLLKVRLASHANTFQHCALCLFHASWAYPGTFYQGS